MKAKDILAYREQQEAHEMQRKIVAGSWQAFKNSPAGRDLDIHLAEMEESALRAIQDCTDFRESSDLIIRYQQRRGICKSLREYIENHIAILGGETDEHDANGTESDNTNYA